jgi:glycosyltransferase involved in cell wall biosynthesis
MPTASIVVPTRDRPDYLDVALASIAPQAGEAGAEVLVVVDGADPASGAIAERHGARSTAHDAPRGLNAARNTGAAATEGDLVVFVDDDVEAPAGWLRALLEAAEAEPGAEAFGGPIRARLEGCRVPMCGRDASPITALDLGTEDRDAERVWGANMAIRRAALERVGPFDEGLDLYGDEEEWQARLRAGGGRIRYVAAAGLDHRRARPDTTLRALARAANTRGRNSRRFDARRGDPPTRMRELRVLAGCVWHTARRRCGNGLVMAAHSAGRVAEALEPAPAPGPDFLTGRSGTVGGRHATLLALRDTLLDARDALSGRRAGLARAARTLPPRRRVLVAGVDRPELDGLMDSARAELARSRHDVEFAIAPATPGRGKFENLNAQLAAHPVPGHDWLLVIDDDVVLPAGFLDVFLFCAERFELRIAQPAHRLRSHAAWPVTRRRAGSVARETAFVEIGPVTAFHAVTFDDLFPFPDLRMGWGLDVHWAALARERGWRIGVVDAVPVAHALRPSAAEYDRDRAVAEAREFLAGRPYVPAAEADRTLAVHRTW